jgi:hypothetical protein
MIRECAAFFPSAALVSLDHDLNPMPGISGDPGTGLDVARFLGDFPPACPVLIHSSNTDLVWSMHNELRFAGWIVDRVGPLGTDWIATSWLTHVRQLLAEHTNTWSVSLPADHYIKEQFVDPIEGHGQKIAQNGPAVATLWPRAVLATVVGMLSQSPTR